MFRLPEAWVWDFWLVDDGEQYHLFFLYASRALRDPHARHYRASIGHAVSSDLVSWERVVDALVRSDAPAFDELATWTGSVVRHPDGRWFMFYTGARLNEHGANVQSIGYAVSPDLYTWDKAPGPVLEADGHWYEKYAPPPEGNWHDEAFRDPWVVADPDGDGWHMLITARSAAGPAHDPSDRVDRGVVGHAWSADLETWELRSPLSEPGAGFGQLEVFQTHVVDGKQVLLFNCSVGDMPEAARAAGITGGVWIASAESVLGPYDLAGAQEIDDPTLYVGKFIDDRETGETKFLAFRNETGGHFIGEITHPYLVTWDGDRVALTPSSASKSLGAGEHG
ncbi:glycosyl hydrolase family 32 [Terrabacter sp. Root85]|uniref:glycoside hydrolase family 68 protein n=1 Tax=Terrabacter sp. Root85 TaxID=1736603 RepID=UPI000701A58A|nr:glycoside hydrolase family 68 protein [Terrabacter sp. Root85]KRC92591.1 glycosyl hydrolase family 32 [Terrabacter sp. Root85]